MQVLSLSSVLHQPLRNLHSSEQIREQLREQILRAYETKARVAGETLLIQAKLLEDPLLIGACYVALAEAAITKGELDIAKDELCIAAKFLFQQELVTVDSIILCQYHMTIGATLAFTHLFLRAIVSYQNAQHHAELASYEEGIQRCIRNIARFYWQTGLPNQALHLSVQVLQREAVSPHTRMFVYETFARIYDQQRRFDLAIYYMNESRSLMAQLPYIAFGWRVVAMCHLARFFLHNNAIAEAHQTVRQAWTILQTEKPAPYYHVMLSVVSAAVAFAQGDDTDIGGRLEQALMLSQTIGNPLLEIESLLLLAKSYLCKSQLPEAIANLTKARQLAVANKFLLLELEICEVLVVSYQERGLWCEAYRALSEQDRLEQHHEIEAGEAHLALFRREQRIRRNHKIEEQNRQLVTLTQRLQDAYDEKNRLIEIVGDQLQQPIAEIQQRVEALLVCNEQLPPHEFVASVAFCRQLVQGMNEQIGKLLDSAQIQNTKNTAGQYTDLPLIETSNTGVQATPSKRQLSQHERVVSLHTQDEGILYPENREQRLNSIVEQNIAEQKRTSFSSAMAYTPLMANFSEEMSRKKLSPHLSTDALEELQAKIAEAAISMAQEDATAALDILKQCKSTSGVASIATAAPAVYCDLFLLEGDILHHIGQVKTATEIYRNVYNVAKATKESSKEQYALCMLGRCYWYLGQMEEASHCFGEVLNHAGSESAAGVANYEILSYICLLQKQPQQALYYRERTISLLQQTSSLVGYALAYQQCELACCQIASGQVAQAKVSLEHAFHTIPDQKKATRTLGLIYQGYSRLFLSEGALVDAETTAKEALTILDEVSSLLNVVDTLFLLGHIYTLQADYRSAAMSLQRALDICVEQSYMSFYTEVCHGLVKLYEAQEQWQEAHNTLVAKRAAWRKYAFSTEGTFHTLLQAEEQMQTQQKLQEQQLQLAQYTKQLQELHVERDDMLAMIAHDLKNPLGVLHYSFSLLSDEDMAMDPQGRRAFLEPCIDISKKMLSLVAELLSTSVAEESHALMLAQQPLFPLLAMMVEQLKLTAQTKEQHLIIHNEDDPKIELYLGYIDRLAFGRVLENIVSNALKYSPPQSTTTISLKECSKAHVCIEVKDEGQGFTQEECSKLFQKYSKLSSRPTGGESSTGLGLYAARKLMRAMHGDVVAESAGKNQGATFVIHVAKAQPVTG